MSGLNGENAGQDKSHEGHDNQAKMQSWSCKTCEL